VTDEETLIFERRDVVYGDDPFKSEDDARPWLILSNHEGVRSTETSIFRSR